MPPLLSVERLTKYFAGLAALQGVSFEVEEGQICGLIGPNGAGKTTLFSIIAGSVSPSSGTITYLGKDVTRWKSFQAVRAGVARTHQITRPFRSMTTRQNVEMGLYFGRGPVSGSSSSEGCSICCGAVASEALRFSTWSTICGRSCPPATRWSF